MNIPSTVEKPITQETLSLTEAEDTSSPQAAYYRLGVSRPPLTIAELPTPENVFGVRHLGWEEIVLFALGPSLIALGFSIGSGEWLLGPLNVSTYGFRGIFWVAFVSILLQVFYNVELARYTLATGESPLLGFGRTPPGALFWIPLALLNLVTAFILGGWTVNAGNSLLALILNRPITTADAETARLIGIALMLTIFPLLMLGRKIERTMEGIQGVFLPYILLGLLFVTIAVVPPGFIIEALLAFLIPARPPAGVDVTLLGALAGFAALAAGLNFVLTGHYRDKGYAMGHYTGYLPTLFNRQGRFRTVGVTFTESETNSHRWRRWFRLLVLDQWGIYFIGALLGMLLPSILIRYLIISSGQAAPTQATVVYAIPQLLAQRYGQLVGGWALVSGFVILYSTQIAVLEALARNLTEGFFGMSTRLRHWLKDEPRRFYYPALGVIILTVSVIIHLQTPVRLNILSANISNLAAMFFPLALIYLNLHLPRPARIRWWSVLVLLANALFFGFFFVNFLSVQIFGSPLVRF